MKFAQRRLCTLTAINERDQLTKAELELRCKANQAENGETIERTNARQKTKNEKKTHTDMEHTHEHENIRGRLRRAGKTL